MKESPVFPGFDTANDSNNHEFEPQIDFSEFLEEAKRYANEKKQKEAEQNDSTKQVKKSKKKSWKKAFLSFWKSSSSNSKAYDNNNKQHSNERSLVGSSSNDDTNPKPRRHVSGPIGGVAAATGARQWHRLAASGPLGSLFHQKKWKDNKNENALPYVSLDKVNQPPYDAKTYGPVYSVS